MLNVEAHATTDVAREVAYLAEYLGDPRSRGSVLDTGSETGARAIALARLGFEVLALAPTVGALARARARAEGEGVQLRWTIGHPLRPDDWPTADVYAVICSDWWAGELNRERLLRRLRQHFASGVRLILSLSAPDIRAQMESIVALVRRAGFAIERTDLNFGDLEPASGGTTIQVVACGIVAPPASLAVSVWGAAPPATVNLDLRYAPDEAELLDPRPADVWLDVAATHTDGVSHYAVDDPFGARRGTAAVSRFFDCDLAQTQVTFAAGVTSLLHDLSGLADGGLIVSDRLVHADLEVWAMTRGIDVQVLPDWTSSDDLERTITAMRPSLVHLDRPGFTAVVLDRAAVERLARAAMSVDACVLIDESALPYLGPTGSAAPLVNQVPNLVVLRGFTKAYSWGGLRVAFAVASREISQHVRELVAPLQVAEQGLMAAMRMLSAGDIFARLRKRIREVKPPTMEALERAGCSVLPGHPDLPWIAMLDTEAERSRWLMGRGIRPLFPTEHPAVATIPDIIRITVPLSEERHRLLLGLLESRTGESHA